MHFRITCWPYICWSESKMCQGRIRLSRAGHISSNRYELFLFPMFYCEKRIWLITTDNTNGDLDTRALWIRLSQSFELPIRCVFFSAPPKVCEHNNTVRALAGDAFNPENRSILPPVAFSSYASRFKKPSMTEGFDDIITLEFQVRYLYIILTLITKGKSNGWYCWQFDGDEQQRQIWSKYWIWI